MTDKDIQPTIEGLPDDARTMALATISTCIINSVGLPTKENTDDQKERIAAMADNIVAGFERISRS